MKKLPILYKLTTKKQTQQWQVIVDGATFYTVEGIKDGKLTTSLPTVCLPKNTGRSNATTAEEQAVAEATAKHKKKLDAGYAEVLGQGILLYSPMLAFELDKTVLDFTKHRVFVQPKLDGIRAISKDMQLLSRNGKLFTSCPHLYQDSTVLDGELYNHEYKHDFNAIVSLVKRSVLSKEDIEQAERNVQYWVYDYPECDGTFSQRYARLLLWYKKKNKNSKIKIVDTYEVFSLDELEDKHGEFLSNGYEGTIVRLDNSKYEHKRSKQLLKYKEFQDEEFIILDVVEGEGGRTGTVGKVTLELNDGTERKFDSNVKGSHEYLKYIWKNKEKMIGKSATVKYFNRTPANIPRFPFVVKIDRDGYE